MYRIKTANLDGAIRLRKRKGEVDPRSALPRDAVENVDAAVALKVDALTNREQGFILNAARGAARGQEDEEPDGVTLHVVEPKLFEHASDKPEVSSPRSQHSCCRWRVAGECVAVQPEERAVCCRWNLCVSVWIGAARC